MRDGRGIAECRLGGPPPLQNQELMSHQDKLGDNGTEPAGLTKSDDGDDCVQKYSESVAHAPDRIKREKLRNSGRLRNSAPTRTRWNPSTARVSLLWALVFC